MRFVVRAADLEADQELLLATFCSHLNPLYNRARFNWLYKDNPHGQAHAWLLSDTDQGTILGAAGAFPRQVHMHTGEATCWVLGDFCIHEHYRSLGPALHLQRACLEAMNPTDAICCYDFPTVRMLAIYKRLRIAPLGNICRLAKPLRVDRKIQEYVRIPFLSRTISALGNLVLAWHDRGKRSIEGVAIALQEGRCGEEFSRLARDIGGQYGVCVQRTAEYLNWRYLMNPLGHYEVLTARRHRALLAYAVFMQTAEDAILADLFGVKDFRVMRCLVQHLIMLLRSRGIVTLSAPLLEAHPWRTFLRQLGFWTREAGPVVVYTSPHCAAAYGPLTEVDWFLMYGDQDS